MLVMARRRILAEMSSHQLAVVPIRSFGHLALVVIDPKSSSGWKRQRLPDKLGSYGK